MNILENHVKFRKTMTFDHNSYENILNFLQIPVPGLGLVLQKLFQGQDF